MKKLNVAVIGQGRSGMDIHGAYFLRDSNNYYNVVAVVDSMEKRRSRAKEVFGCDVYSDYTALFGRDDIDLVVNSTFSHMHYPVTMELLNHKFNVLVEKPFARYAKECDDMIEAANKNGVMLAVFQQSRFAPYYKQIKEILKSGVLGEIIQINISFSGFSRRWDWQCSQRYNGGSLLNTGPHPVDQALDLLACDEMPNVFSKLACVNTSGDAEDYVKAILTAPDKPLIDIEISSCDGHSDYTYKIQGSCGSLKGTGSEINWKYFIPKDEKPRPLILEPLQGEDGSPMYCTEQLKWHEHSEEVKGSAFTSAVDEFYADIYNHLVNGKPLTVSPQQVRQQIAVMEEVHRQNPLPVIY